MKKYLSVLMVLAFVFSFSFLVVNAEDGDSDMNKGEEHSFREEMMQRKATWDLKNGTKREAAKTAWEKLKESLKNEKDAARAKVKGMRLQMRENALGRFDNVANMLARLEDKVNMFIDNLDEKGLDVDAAEAFVDTADTKISQAKDKVAEIEVILSKSIDELTVADKAKLKTLAMETQTLLKDAHSALKDAVKSLREQIKMKMMEDKPAKDKDEGEGDDSE